MSPETRREEFNRYREQLVEYHKVTSPKIYRGSQQRQWLEGNMADLIEPGDKVKWPGLTSLRLPEHRETILEVVRRAGKYSIKVTQFTGGTYRVSGFVMVKARGEVPLDQRCAGHPEDLSDFWCCIPCDTAGWKYLGVPLPCKECGTSQSPFRPPQLLRWAKDGKGGMDRIEQTYCFKHECTHLEDLTKEVEDALAYLRGNPEKVVTKRAKALIIQRHDGECWQMEGRLYPAGHTEVIVVVVGACEFCVDHYEGCEEVEELVT